MDKLQINEVEIAKMPNELKITLADLDYSSSGSVTRAVDGTLSRNRIAGGPKRTIEMQYSALPWATMSALLTQMQDEFFDVYYPDPMSGTYETRTFYVSDRPVGVIKTTLNKGSNITWGGMTFTLVEQ